MLLFLEGTASDATAAEFGEETQTAPETGTAAFPSPLSLVASLGGASLLFTRAPSAAVPAAFSDEAAMKVMLLLLQLKLQPLTPPTTNELDTILCTGVLPTAGSQQYKHIALGTFAVLPLSRILADALPLSSRLGVFRTSFVLASEELLRKLRQLPCASASLSVPAAWMSAESMSNTRSPAVSSGPFP